MRSQIRYRAAGLVLWLLLVVPALLAILAALAAVFFAPLAVAKNALRQVDEGVCAALCAGPANVTLSAWAWEKRHTAWARLVIFATDLLQPGHCRGAWERELQPKASA